MNCVTKNYLDKVKTGSFPNLFITPKGKVTPTVSFKEKIINSTYRKNVAQPKEAPYIKQEGIFTGTLLKKYEMETAEGTVLTLSLPNQGVYRIGIFFNGFTYSPDDILHIDEILPLLSEGDEVTVRVGRNFRGTKFYIRYLKWKDYEVGNLTERNCE